MTKKTDDQYRSHCPLNIALELLGDHWSLLIIRDALFTGVGSFNGFLASPEKIATNDKRKLLLRDSSVRVNRSAWYDGYLSLRPMPKSWRKHSRIRKIRNVSDNQRP